MKLKKNVPLLLFAIAIFVWFGLLSSCKKENAEPAPPPETGLAKGECRLIKMNDTATLSYNSKNQITKISNYVYSYATNQVKMTDSKVEMEYYLFNLNAIGLPINMGRYGLTDTIAQDLTWFVYNADSTLNTSRSYIWVKDKYVFTGKSQFTWTNKNLTRFIAYGTDTTKVQWVENISYDLTKIDKRKSNYEKMYRGVPIYALDILPKCASVNLATGLSLQIGTNPTAFYTITQTLDSKSNVTREAIKDKDAVEVVYQNYVYECN